MTTARPSFFTPRARPLTGRDIVLRPLGRRDAAELELVPDDPAWELLIRRPAGAGMNAGVWLADALRGMRSGRERAWTIRDRATGQLLGSTRFLNIERQHKRLEIGATWLLPEARGSSANLESKLLLLDHAFGTLDIERVHIQADVRNERSRAAIAALGATFEGVLRRHLVLPDGSTRDTAVYSILREEWPQLRPALAARLETRTPSWRARESSLATDVAASTVLDDLLGADLGIAG